MRFSDRDSAGQELGEKLHEFSDDDSVVLALPRGGVTLGYQVAKALQAPLDIILVRKIGHPASPEYAVGALAEGGQPVYNENEVRLLDDEWREDAEKNARQLMTHRRKQYFDDHYTAPDLSQKTLIIVDDGIATGLTMKAALLAVADNNPRRIVVATPVASEESIHLLQGNYDRIIVLDNPLMFQGSISMHYDDFPQVVDDEVKNILERSHNYAARKTSAAHP